MESNDQTLLNQWYQHGDAEAFHQITRRYAGLVYGTCRRILRNPSDAEDVAQECFETLAVKTRADGRALGAWLHTVATRRALDRIKTESRRRDREQRAYVAQPAHESTDWDEIYVVVDEAIAELPEKERVPLVAHFLEGHTHAEIAARMGISRPTAGYRIQKGLERIRRDLKRRNITTTSASLGVALGAGLAAEPAPATLIAGLRKLAVSSLPATGIAAQSLITTTIAGSIVMKKALMIGIVIVVIVGGLGLFIRSQKAAPISTPLVTLSADASDTNSELAENEKDSEAAPPAQFIRTPDNGGLAHGTNAEPGNLVIAGRIVDVNGGPIEGAFIQVLGYGTSPHARTNEDGFFRLTGLSAGKYTRHISLNGYEDQHQSSLKAGDENVVIVLQRKRPIGLIKELMHNLGNYVGIGG